MRGCQKKVIFLKNVGSPIFEEAYFVLRCDNSSEMKSTEDMICEANRIIEENIGIKRRIDIKRACLYFLFFTLGAMISAIFAIAM